MSDLTVSTSHFLQLPRELRLDIYDYLAECEDMTPLTQTCRQLRREVWSRMPGGRETDYARPQSASQLGQQIKRHVKIMSLQLIAEPWYSSGSALKMSAAWRPRGCRRYRWTTWTIRDLASPMARWALFCHPRHARVVFTPPPFGANQQMALLILCCKVLDIIRMLILIRLTAVRLFQRRPLEDDHGECLLQIFFCDRPNQTRWSPPHHARSFWEMRPALRPYDMREIRTRIRQGEISRIPEQSRDNYPFFYECLMLPFFGLPLWEPQVEFEGRLPARKNTSFFATDMAQHRSYHSFRALCATAVRATNLGMDRFLSQDPVGYLEWKRVADLLCHFQSGITNLMEDEEGTEATQLRSFLRRMSTSHHINAFVDLPAPDRNWRLRGVVNSAYGRDYPREDDYMRRSLMEWARHGPSLGLIR